MAGQAGGGAIRGKWKGRPYGKEKKKKKKKNFSEKRGTEEKIMMKLRKWAIERMRVCEVEKERTVRSDRRLNERS